jgi:hypothetical protein
MSKIIESRFRVLDIISEDILLSDLETGPPVCVEKNDSSYTPSIEDTIEEIEEGNLIEAEIRSESVAQQDSLWFFVSIDIKQKTQFHFIKGADSHPDIVNSLKRDLNYTHKDSIMKGIPSDGERLGYMTVGRDETNSRWKSLRSGTRSHEKHLSLLSDIGSPPYQVIYSKDDEHIVFYHFCEKESKLAEKIIESNT